MKMSRDDLKDLIKECLVEILAEGLGGELNEAVARSPRRGRGRPRYRSMTRPGRGGGSSQNTNHDGLPTAALRNAVLESAHGNPIMQDILADTAMTTLPTMLSNPGAPPPMPGSAEAVVAQHAPEQMFGEDAQRWASLAFEAKSSGPSPFVPPPPPATVRKLSDAELDAPVGVPKKTA